MRRFKRFKRGKENLSERMLESMRAGEDRLIRRKAVIKRVEGKLSGDIPHPLEPMWKQEEGTQEYPVGRKSHCDDKEAERVADELLAEILSQDTEEESSPPSNESTEIDKTENSTEVALGPHGEIAVKMKRRLKVRTSAGASNLFKQRVKTGRLRDWPNWEKRGIVDADKMDELGWMRPKVTPHNYPVINPEYKDVRRHWARKKS